MVCPLLISDQSWPLFPDWFSVFPTAPSSVKAEAGGPQADEAVVCSLDKRVREGPHPPPSFSSLSIMALRAVMAEPLGMLWALISSFRCSACRRSTAASPPLLPPPPRRGVASSRSNTLWGVREAGRSGEALGGGGSLMLVTFCSPIPLPVVSVLMIKRSHLTEHAYWGIVWTMRPHLFPSGLKTAALEMCVDLEMLPEPTCPPSGPSRRRRRTWRRWRRRSCRTWTALFLLHHKGRTRTSQGACGLTTNQIYLSICLSN